MNFATQVRGSLVFIFLTGTLFRAGRFVFTAALGSVIGILVGGFVFGWANFVLKSEFLRTYAMDISWSLGFLLGFITAVKQLKKPFWSEDDKDGPADPQVFKRQWPTLKHFLGATGFLGFVGAILGVALSLFLAVLLVSVTTCPVVPDSWAPKFGSNQRYVEQERERERVQGTGRNGATMSITVSHPLLWPTVCTSVAIMTFLGAGFGMYLSFYPEADNTSK